jgi:hypothetical protein
MLNQKITFFILFVVLGFATLQVPVAHLAGSKATFTFFDAFGPIAPAFLGTIPGIVAVFLMQLINFFIHGSKVLDPGTIIRFLPMLFTAMYFGKKTSLNWIIPALAIIVFNANPVGRSVWFYSMFWLIPVICYFWQDKSLLARSLGATFMAHAAGGAIWIWVFNLPSAVWIGLIPVVIVERLLFALSIALNYKLMSILIKLTIGQFMSTKKHEIYQN